MQIDINFRIWQDSDDFRRLMEGVDHRLTDNFFPSSPSDEEAERWVDEMYYRNFAGEIHYAVEWKGRFVGGISVTKCKNAYERNGALHLVILPDCCGLGIGTEALRKLLEQAPLHCTRNGGILEPSFSRLTASVIGDNPAAVRVLEKNLFTYEGPSFESIRKNGVLYEVKPYVFVIPPLDAQQENELKAKKKRMEYFCLPD